jgi:L-iditol 2-dehydrogenase
MGETLPATMRAAFLLRPGELTLREVAVPRPAAGEVLVRVEAALTCGTDVKMYQRGHARLLLPAPFGHEFAGRIAAVGEGVATFVHDDPVMCVPTAPCGSCRLCAAGRANLCAAAVGRMVLGAYAEYVLLPAHIVARHLFHRPATLSAERAATLEPLACVVHGAARIDWLRAQHVAVLGDGAIALLFACLALLRGAAAVLVLGRHPERLAVAATYGAHTVRTASNDEALVAVRDHTGGAGADVVVECVGTPATWRLASELTAAGGTALLFGGCAAGAQASFDAYRLHYEEVDLVGAFHYTPHDVADALTLLGAGRVDVAPLITHRAPLQDLEAALQRVMDRSAIKVAIVP